MTIVNPAALPSSSASSGSSLSPAARARRARLAAATQPLRPGPATAVVANGPAASTESGCVTLTNSQLRLEVAPWLGGGVTGFDWRGEEGLVPVFRRCLDAGPETDPNQLACYPLLPYSNRIGGGRFDFNGRAFDVPCNRADEPLPIHGDGWLVPWQVAALEDTRVRLTLERANGRPYAFRAAQTYTLRDATLSVTLDIENLGREALPFGLGLHPFLTRDADTQLAAAAAGLWLSGADWLPVRHVMAPPAWQFGVAYPLPAALVNHAFTGWSGAATVVWPERRLSLTMTADTGYYVLYTPVGENFFCFEPVDHPVNALNLPGGGAAHGMTVLAPGERLAREFRFTVERTGMRETTARRRTKRACERRA